MRVTDHRHYPFTITRTDSGLSVLRDDLLQGGTKRRALRLMLDSIPEAKIAYAGTVMGHGALALSHACADVGKTAHIFIGADTPFHPMIIKIKDAGAQLHIQNPMPVSQIHSLSTAWQKGTHDCAVLPPGFDSGNFGQALAASLAPLDLSPYTEIWTSCVSGTLTRALQTSFPGHVFKTVKVVKAGWDLGPAQVFHAPEKYHQTAKIPPPYPSCPHTDAKLWQFAREYAGPDALLWNTAG